MSRVLLVTGATGKQGSGVVKALLKLKADFQILALTRNAESPSAKRLASQSSNIVLIQGNLDDTEAIFQSAQKLTPAPIWGVYSVQAPAFKGNGFIIEEAQGKALIDSSIKHGVKYFVYSSVDRNGEKSFDNPTDIPHFRSKHNIEHHLVEHTKNKEMDWTILRPVAFMDNFTADFVGKVFATAWRDVVKSRPLQLIATEDIGFFAAFSFMNPEKFNRKAISLAGDELTYGQLEQVFQEKCGIPPPTTYSFLAKMVMRFSEEFRTMFQFFEREGYGADIQAVREIYPKVKSLATWLENSSFAKR
ncbi:uncharacterized protein V1516DRAFT_671744 [Lipomyces oligophaga]|uniref:uncharacterized protein n=1 Tax=Lipomyces oligophaga TaxID=45792 RepID=UPI0034CEC02A